MARSKTYTPLSVFLNGRRLGQLARQPNGAVSFAYDADWLNWEHALPVSISLPLREDRYSGAGVIAVFDNLLPDNTEIRRRVAGRTGAAGTDPFSLLSKIGRDCVGALQFLPEGDTPQALDQIIGDKMSDHQIGSVLRSLGSDPLGIDENDAFRISIAGVQEKTALTRRQGQWLKPNGTTPTTHIFKPPIGRLPNGIDLTDSVANEYLCLRFLSFLGLPVANAEMAKFDDQDVLIVERFDRVISDTRILRLPQEDMCQALGISPDQKYQSDGGPNMKDILGLLIGSDQPSADRSLFIKAQMAFLLLGATDGHAKNFSVFSRPGGRFSMTPLYDVISAEPAFTKDDLQRKAYRLAMSVGDNRHYKIHEIRLRHFEQTAVASGLSLDLAKDAASELLEHLPDALSKAKKLTSEGVPSALIEAVLSGVQSRADQLRG